jgi:hypothetical protein
MATSQSEDRRTASVMKFQDDDDDIKDYSPEHSLPKVDKSDINSGLRIKSGN